MKKVFVFAMVCMALCVGLSACGSDKDDPIVVPKKEMSEWNGYAKTLTWVSMTKVNSLLIFSTSDSSLDKERTEVIVKYTIDKKVSTDTDKKGEVYTAYAKTIKNGMPWITFDDQNCDGSIRFVDTGRRDSYDNTVWDVTMVIDAMKDTQGKWAEKVTVHCVGTIGGMLEY